MTLQLEDVVDCLNVLCPEFDYLFLFDHSQGHARKRDGALDADKMSNNFGGSQPISQGTSAEELQPFQETAARIRSKQRPSCQQG
jgi:hypothetical protein